MHLKTGLAILYNVCSVSQVFGRAEAVTNSSFLSCESFLDSNSRTRNVNKPKPVTL